MSNKLNVAPNDEMANILQQLSDEELIKVTEEKFKDRLEEIRPLIERLKAKTEAREADHE